MNNSYDLLSTNDLFKLVKDQNHPRKADKALWALRKRATQEVFDRACLLCSRKKLSDRVLGVEILAQLGLSNLTFAEPSKKIVAEMLERTRNEILFQSLCYAACHLQASECIPYVVKHVENPNRHIRYAVANALLAQESDVAIEAMIVLSRDRSPRIREFACWALGSVLTVDTPNIKGALLARIRDSNYETRMEAQLGLAIRHDMRVLNPIKTELSCDSVSAASVEAAAKLARPELLPALMQLKKWWTLDTELLELAINNCSLP